MIVLDASAAIELLLQTDTGAAVADRVQGEGLHAPHLLDVEVAQVVRRFVRERAIGANDGLAALDVLEELDIERYEHGPLLGRAWELRDNMTIYDGVYVALAEALGASLLTGDEKLARTRVRGVQVEVVGPS